jgi:hypothetical protein
MGFQFCPPLSWAGNELEWIRMTPTDRKRIVKNVHIEGIGLALVYPPLFDQRVHV